jgi:hypothetical protein
MREQAARDLKSAGSRAKAMIDPYPIFCSSWMLMKAFKLALHQLQFLTLNLMHLPSALDLSVTGADSEHFERAKHVVPSTI